MEREVYHKIWKLLNVGLTSKIYHLIYHEPKTITQLARIIYKIDNNKRPPRNRITEAVKKMESFNLIKKIPSINYVKTEVYYKSKMSQKIVKALLSNIDDEIAKYLSKIFERNWFRKIAGWNKNDHYPERVHEVNDLPNSFIFWNLTHVLLDSAEEFKVESKNFIKEYNSLKIHKNKKFEKVLDKIEEKNCSYRNTLAFLMLPKEIFLDLKHFSKGASILWGEPKSPPMENTIKRLIFGDATDLELG